MISEDFASRLNNAALVGIILLAILTTTLTCISFWAGNIKQTYVEQRANTAFQRSAWRILDDRNWQVLRDGLAAVRNKQLIIFEWNGFDNETALFAKRILSAMKAGYPPDKIQDAGLDSTMHFPDGITAAVNDDETGRMIGNAFVNAGLVKTVSKNATLSRTQAAYIKVGPKPFIPTQN